MRGPQRTQCKEHVGHVGTQTAAEIIVVYTIGEWGPYGGKVR